MLCVLFVLRVAFVLWRYRLEAFPAAADALQELADGIKVQKLSCGVAFVPTSAPSRVGLVYFPGALVHHLAYAPMCREMARRTGGAVILLDLPLRLPVSGFGPFGAPKVPDIVSHVPDVPRWVVGGHSAGGLHAAKCIQGSNPKRSAPESQHLLPKVNLVGLLLHASYTPADAISIADRDDIAVMQILGENDKVLQWDKMEEGKAALPPQAEQRVLSGCNHASFGFYGPQVYPRPDGEAALTKDESQRIITETTAKWLSSLDGRS